MSHSDHTTAALARSDRVRLLRDADDKEASARLGDYFAEVLLLDQATGASRARAELGWKPSHPGLVDEFLGGSCRKVSAAT